MPPLQRARADPHFLGGLLERFVGVAIELHSLVAELRWEPPRLAHTIPFLGSQSPMESSVHESGDGPAGREGGGAHARRCVPSQWLVASRRPTWRRPCVRTSDEPLRP